MAIPRANNKKIIIQRDEPKNPIDKVKQNTKKIFR